MANLEIKPKKYFTNCISLNYTNKSVNKIYQKENEKYFPKRAIIFSIADLVINILILIYQHWVLKYFVRLNQDPNEPEQKNQFLPFRKNEISNRLEQIEYIFNITYSTLGINLICLIFSIITIKKKQLINLANLFIFTTVSLGFMILRDIIQIYKNNTFGILFYTELIMKGIYIFLVDCNYKIFTLSTIITSILSWTMGSFTSDVEVVELIWNNVLFIIILGISFLVEKNLKILFYYKWKVLRKNEWLKSILNNFENGIIVIDKKRMHYYNDYVGKNLKFLLEPQEESFLFNVGSDLSNKEYGNYYLTKNILKNLENLNPDLSIEVLNAISSMSLRDALEVIENDNNLKKNFKDFKFIGIKKFESNKEATLEIFLRIIEKGEKKTVFEFIFNNVTRSKVIEEAKAQMKYKTLFLAKVAHEFKNPLIIIKELVDQIMENIQNQKFYNKSINFNEQLLLTKNLSSYMLILVKDFEVISKKENSSKIELNIGNFNIREEMDYLKQIVQSLIWKKFGHFPEDNLNSFNSPISFYLNISENVPEKFVLIK